jgi:hypothetical protein
MDLVTLAVAKKYTDKAIAQAAVGDIDVEVYVKEAVDDVIGSASETFNSLGEIETAVNNKVDKVSGKGLSTNDFTDAYKNKVDSALQSYTETDPTVPAWAKAANKPTYTASEVGALPSTTTIPTTLAGLTEDATHRVVTDAEKAAWDAKSNFSGSYNDLTNKPTIPSIAGLATEEYVNNAVANKEFILNSSTEGSTKKFKVTVDDTGALTAVEVTE